MKKFIVFIVFASTFVNALTLNQVQEELNTSSIAQDSIQIRIRTTVSSSLIDKTQDIYLHLVRKGDSKILTELNLPFLNQRTIVNGNKMKVIDLSTRKSEILPYNGEPLKALTYANFNPLTEGEWQEPKLVSDNIYSINGGEKGILYYNSKKKRIEKIESENNKRSTLTTFTYDSENNMKTMKTSVMVDGKETVVLTEVLLLRHSRDFADRLFEF